MTQEITNIIEEIVSAFDYVLTGEFDSNTNRFITCNTKWARVGKIVKDDAQNDYLITSILVDSYIELEPIGHANEPNTVIYLPTPFWITGTKLATNAEWSKAEKSLMKKTPLAWLLEVIRLRKYGRDSVIEFESDLRMFFLDETNATQYYTSDHRENVVFPMERLALEFIEQIENNRNFQTIDQYDIVTFSRFGVERENGMFQNVLDANLSGVELRITLAKFKENCKC